MKKGLKRIVVLMATVATLALAAIAGGCDAKETVETYFDQLTCAHEYDAGAVTKAATCTEQGELTYTCTLCAKTKTEAIALIEHKPQTVGYRAPTCKSDGHAEYTKCQTCGQALTEKHVLKATGHTTVTISAIAPTCNRYGWTVGKKCSTCGEILEKQVRIDKLPHTEEGTDGICDVCGDPFSSDEAFATATYADVAIGDSLSGWYRVCTTDEVGKFFVTADYWRFADTFEEAPGEELLLNLTIQYSWAPSVSWMEGNDVGKNFTVATADKVYGEFDVHGVFSAPYYVTYNGYVYVYTDGQECLMLWGDTDVYPNGIAVLYSPLKLAEGSVGIQKVIFAETETE